jgi:hypothetical protein
VTWTARSSGLMLPFNDVACSDLNCVMVSDSGQIEASLDGVTWSGRSSGTANHLKAVVWNGLEYLIVGSQGTALKSP